MFDALSVAGVRDRRASPQEIIRHSVWPHWEVSWSFMISSSSFSSRTRLVSFFFRPRFRNGYGNFRPSAFSLPVISRDRSVVY